MTGFTNVRAVDVCQALATGRRTIMATETIGGDTCVVNRRA